jgi:hypothetical protein
MLGQSTRRDLTLTDSGHTSSPPTNPRHQARTRAWIVVVALTITALVLTIIPVMRHIAAARRAEHQHTFMEYVTLHHLGTLTVVDSGTGLDPISYVLTINRPVPISDRQQYITELMKRYYLYDKGEVLSVVYHDPRTGRDQPIASAHYDDTRHALQLTINQPSGDTRIVTEHVVW